MAVFASPRNRRGRELTAIYREHSPGAYRYAYHLTGSREDADDLVQIAFLQMHRTLARGERIAVPAAWLATVIKRRALNLFAGRREQPASDRSDVAEGGADADVDHDANAQLAQVQAVLYTLPESQHHAFVLRHWSGLSNREIASVLETTESAVESLLVRARAGVLAAGAGDAQCADVCARLADDRPLTPEDAAHVAGCSRCGTAQTRLKQAAAIAGIALLAPSIHVGHALAAAVPGFTLVGAGAGAGAGTVGAGGGGAAIASKTGAVAALAKTAAATLAVTATVVTVHSDLNTGPHSRQAQAKVEASHHHGGHESESNSGRGSSGGHGSDDAPGDDRGGRRSGSDDSKSGSGRGSKHGSSGSSGPSTTDGGSSGSSGHGSGGGGGSSGGGSSGGGGDSSGSSGSDD